MKTQTLAEYRTAIAAQGLPIEQVLMKCPMCGTIQCANDLIKAGAGENMAAVEPYLGFSCVGRWTHKKGPPKEKGTQVGCNWTLGGLFRIADLTVVLEDDSKHLRFEICTPEEVNTHLESLNLVAAELTLNFPT